MRSLFGAIDLGDHWVVGNQRWQCSHHPLNWQLVGSCYGNHPLFLRLFDVWKRGGRWERGTADKNIEVLCQGL